MNVNLTPALEKLVHGKVKSGRYNSASEVVREALRLMERHDQERTRYLASLDTKIEAGLHSLDRRQSIDGPAFFKSLEHEERTRAKAKSA